MAKELPSKICSKCEKERYLFEFQRNRNHKDGLAYHCKECMKKGKKPTEYDIVSKNVPRQYFKNW